MNNPPKYLKPEDVSKVLVKFLDFEGQKVVDERLRIKCTCPSCLKERWLAVAQVRNKAKNKHDYTGYCGDCYRPPKGILTKPLRPDEIKSELHKYLNFDTQKVQGYNMRIEVTCKKCGLQWMALVGSVRRNQFSALCTRCQNRKENHPLWQGGRYKVRGYIHRNIRDDHEHRKLIEPMLDTIGRISEHRLIMALHLGRPLESWEHVHHINGVKDDNRIENLYLIDAKSHAAVSWSEKETLRYKRENKVLKRRIEELEKKLIELEVAL